MNFAWAIERLVAGEKVRRKVFSPKTHIKLNPNQTSSDRVLMRIGDKEVRYRCAHSDFLADDWEGG